MQKARSATKPAGRVPAIENRRLQPFARMQHVAKVEGIEAAGDPYRVHLILLDRDSPRPAPPQRAKPNLAVLLVGIAGLERKPGIGLMARRTSAALNYPRSGMHLFLSQIPLSRPTPGEVVQRISSGRQRPRRGGSLLHRHRLRLAVLNGRRTRQNPALRIHLVV